MSLLHEYGPLFLHGLALTLALAAVSWVLAFTVGLTLALLRMTKVKLLEWVVIAFVEYQRNVPPLVHIFLWYFGVSSMLAQGLQDWANAHHGEFYFSALAIGLYYGAYVAEDIRSGLRSIPNGQLEAARALGLGYFGAMRRVVLPQALRVAVAPLVSGAVMLVKTTSLAMMLGVMELTYVTKDVASKTFKIFESYGISTALYVAVALALLFLGSWLSRRFRIKDR
ncbi:MAG: amino acid ABC transporter permease [Ottowia sp.]|uniref:amino acid ABC transporter permease n=1 Tax=Ottowia sp. TaxID=1898956 RepID=UPI003C71EBA5